MNMFTYLTIFSGTQLTAGFMTLLYATNVLNPPDVPTGVFICAVGVASAIGAALVRD